MVKGLVGAPEHLFSHPHNRLILRFELPSRGCSGLVGGRPLDAAHVCVHVSVCRDGVEFATARECECDSLPLCLLCGRVAEVQGLLDKCQKGFSYWFSRAAFLSDDRLKVTVGQRNRVFVHLSLFPHHGSAALQL